MLTAGGAFLEAARQYQVVTHQLDCAVADGSQRLDLARLFGGVECVLQLLCIAVLGFPKSPDIS